MAMFEFGKDLRRLFGQAREGMDWTWLELIGADLLEIEARQQAADSGRPACRRPAAAWLRASMLWGEHARRTGQALSLTKAISAAQNASDHAGKGTAVVEAQLAMTRALLLEHELRGTEASLQRAMVILDGLGAPGQACLAARVSALHALARSRSARAQGAGGLQHRADAAALLDAAFHDLSAHPHLTIEIAEVQLERAALTLEGGIRDRDPRLLDLAGRDLRDLIQACAPDDRPITRARALTLCAAGLAHLAKLADNAEARTQATAMFDAAAETFTPDHSPLDWVAILLSRDGREPARVGELRLAQRLTDGQGLILGAQVRARRRTLDIDAARTKGDVTRLLALEADILNRLACDRSNHGPLDWVVEQIALAELRAVLRRFTGSTEDSGLVLALMEAADVAREYGVADMADHAEAIRAALWTTPSRSR